MWALQSSMSKYNYKNITIRNIIFYSITPNVSYFNAIYIGKNIILLRIIKTSLDLLGKFARVTSGVRNEYFHQIWDQVAINPKNYLSLTVIPLLIIIISHRVLFII